jgi:hypothetical protein
MKGVDPTTRRCGREDCRLLRFNRPSRAAILRVPIACGVGCYETKARPTVGRGGAAPTSPPNPSFFFCLFVLFYFHRARSRICFRLLTQRCRRIITKKKQNARFPSDKKRREATSCLAENSPSPSPLDCGSRAERFLKKKNHTHPFTSDGLRVLSLASLRPFPSPQGQKSSA